MEGSGEGDSVRWVCTICTDGIV